MASPFVVHQSTVKAFRRCQKEFEYKDIEHLVPRKPKKPLIRGTVIHEMIENHIEGEDPWAPLKNAEKVYGKLFREEREMYGDFVGDIRAIMEGYFSWWEKDPIKFLKSKVTGKKSEHKFRIELGNGIILEGKIDGVGQTKDGRVWLVDHKSVGRMPDAFRYSDIQSALYTKAVPSLGLPRPDGVCWNYLRAKPPTVPEMLKSGELTKRQNIDTTWAVYLREIKKRKLDPADYAEMKTLLEGKEADFFFRDYLPVNNEIMKNLAEEATITGCEMREKVDGGRFIRNVSFDCDRCTYFGLCQAELRGLDADFIRKHDFKVEIKDDKKAKKVSIEEE